LIAEYDKHGGVPIFKASVFRG